ncbi:recombinase family protein [Vibrio alginolyticus]
MSNDTFYYSPLTETYEEGTKVAIRVYLRASAKHHDFERVKAFIAEKAIKYSLDLTDAIYYTEGYSSRSFSRPQLTKLIEDTESGDIIFIEQIDHLARLTSANWKELKESIHGKGLHIIVCDVPSSFKVLEKTDDDTERLVIEAVQTMLLEVFGATASKDYEDQRKRQAEGIARNSHKFKGRPVNPETARKCEKVHESVEANGRKLEEALQTINVGRATYFRWKKKQNLTKSADMDLGHKSESSHFSNEIVNTLEEPSQTFSLAMDREQRVMLELKKKVERVSSRMQSKPSRTHVEVHKTVPEEDIDSLLEQLLG